MGRMRWTLVSLALLGGCFMPAFYDWTGADQSRPAPIVLWIALGILLLDVVALAWVIGWQSKPHEDSTEKTRWRRFNIAQLLIATACIAVMAAPMNIYRVSITRALVFALLVYAIWLAVQNSRVRWQIATLLTSMWAPFLWLFHWRETAARGLGWLFMLADVPALIVAGWTSMLLRWNFLGDSGLGAFFTLAELAIGIWLIHQGPRRGMIYTLGTLTVALVSSFALHALMRA